LGTAALHGASTEGFDRLADFHILKDIGLPEIGNLNRIVWYALIDGVALVLGIVGLATVRRRTHLNGHAHVARLLRVIDLVLIGGVVVFGLAGVFWLAVARMWPARAFWLAVVMMVLVIAVRNVCEPIFDAWVNQGLDPATRATVNSMGSQSDAIGQADGGPELRVSGNASVPAAPRV